MKGKQLTLDKVFDVCALRVIVADVSACYVALSRVHELWHPMPEEFSDDIAKPKANGYQSLHTVVRDEQSRPIEIQDSHPGDARTRRKRCGSTLAYKEAGTKGYGGVQAAGDFESRVAEARKTVVLREPLAWERHLAAATTLESGTARGGLFDDRIYVFTPGGEIIDLPCWCHPH